ncbi:uncharacterized protein LOC144058474 [Vanacampus margaritifer]
MESVERVKKSFRAPIRRFTSCVSAVRNNRKLRGKRRKCKVGRWGRGRCGRSGKAPRPTPAAKYPAVARTYQADLDKERKLREATNAQKNAERAAMRAHFRRKYQLSENCEDAKHLKCVGGKVSLPRRLSELVRPDGKSKDGGFDLLHAFRGLRLGGNAARRAPQAPQRGRACQVM